jgi:putative endonuclease
MHFAKVGGTVAGMLGWLKNLFADTSDQKRDALGDRGENVAAKHLRDKGYRIITRNFRCELGEMDIIARDGKTLVFVEVKTRAYDDPTPEEQVNPGKQQTLTRIAKLYLSRYGIPQPPARFDVVAVVWPNGQKPIIRHVEAAFDAVE